MNIYKKWEPIIDMIIPNKSDKIKIGLCEIAEDHSLKYVNGIFENWFKLLPLSMKIASELTELDRIIESGNLILSKEPVETRVLKIKISLDDIMEYPNVEHYESLLRNEFIDFLRKELKYATSIKIHKLVSKIYLDKENRDLCLYSDYKIIGSREDKLKRIVE